MTVQLGARDAGAALTQAVTTRIPLLVPVGRQMAPFIPASPAIRRDYPVGRISPTICCAAISLR